MIFEGQIFPNINHQTTNNSSVTYKQNISFLLLSIYMYDYYREYRSRIDNLFFCWNKVHVFEWKVFLLKNWMNSTMFFCFSYECWGCEGQQHEQQHWQNLLIQFSLVNMKGRERERITKSQKQQQQQPKKRKPFLHSVSNL